MQAALKRDDISAMERPLIDPNWQDKPILSHEEFWDMTYKHLGSLYGLNDIREANKQRD